MNRIGDLIQKELSKEDSVLELGCGIMQTTLDTCPTYPKTKLKCREYVGVDAFKPYVDFLNKRSDVKAVFWDLRNVPYPFQDKSFDVVLLIDILEHMISQEALDNLLEEANRVARKKIIAYAPEHFYDNKKNAGENADFPYGSFGSNVLQEHHLVISKEFLEDNGFYVTKLNMDNGVFFGVKPVHLRVLHVWDQAGVGCLMAKYQQLLGHDAEVVMRDEYDGGCCRYYGFTKFLSGNVDLKNLNQLQTPSKTWKRYIPLRVKRFIRRVRRMILSLKWYWNLREIGKDYDIIHVHSVWKALFLFPFKKKVLEYHGDDVRWKPSRQSKLDRYSTRLFNMVYGCFHPIFVSTADLILEAPNSVWLPNPVDTELFSRRSVGFHDLSGLGLSRVQDCLHEELV